MGTVSLCMIVRDEEDVLGRCLDSVKDLVDEIIIVDTGSHDRTKEIARQYTEKIFDFPWIDDFSAARNFSFDKASCAYCMWLDADDILLQEDRERFKELKEELAPEVEVVMMPYHVGFDETGQLTFSYYRERLVKNYRGMRWKGPVHEVIETRGHRVYADCAVTHWKLHPSDPDRNLRIFQGILAKGESLEPRQQFYYGRELYYHQEYAQALAVFEGFLSQGQGWVENQIDACRHCARCLYGLCRAEEALLAFFRSFSYDVPRAEICCDIGQHFLDREQWRQAAYWYRQALRCERQDDKGGFVLPDAYGYEPYLGLCLCSSRLGNEQEAEAYNELAAACKPDSPAIAYNRAYFASLKKT
ncbi:MAG: glycosyltransferase family 2 protein [Acutalibacter sp.]|nr:glycosyltransferase family 2 protein [Acutalibacter sp.]